MPSSSSSSSKRLARLRSEVESLQSYQLPNVYQLLLPPSKNTAAIDNDNDANNTDKENDATQINGNNEGNDDGGTDPLLFYNAKLVQRYRTARDTYLRHRTTELFVESLYNSSSSNDNNDGNDGNNNNLTFQFPSPLTPEEVQQQSLKQDEILTKVRSTMDHINGGIDQVRSKYETFCAKREELMEIVEGMEGKERERLTNYGELANDDKMNDNDNNDDTSDEDDEEEEEEVTQEQLQQQSQKLQTMLQRKTNLQKKLRTIKAQILDVEEDVHRTKRVVNEVRVASGRRPLDWRRQRRVATGTTNGNSSSGGNGNDINTNENHDDDDGVDYISIKQDVQSDIAEMEERTLELKQSSEFYNGMRELMEELGGVKILSTKSISSGGGDAVDGAGAAGGGSGKCLDAKETSGGKRQKIGMQIMEEEQDFVLTLMLLGSHILEIVLKKKKKSTTSTNTATSPADSSNPEKDGLYIHTAKLITPTTFPMPVAKHDNDNNNDNAENNNENTLHLLETIHSLSFSSLAFSKILSQKQSTNLSIPPLHDLVTWSNNTNHYSDVENSFSQGIRFVVVETMERLRIMEARVLELETLTRRYAAQVYDKEQQENTTTTTNNSSTTTSNEEKKEMDHYYGGAEQEVVCAINEGITVAIRLGADCPLVPGSAYISEMFGVGGWEEGQLEELKEAVLERRCKGPVEVMEVLVGEIRRRRKEDGWVVPLTPSFPRCQK